MYRFLRLLLLASACSTCAYGWGCEGHQIVALIARAHLSADASAAVDDLLRGNPIDASLNRFCKDRPSDLLADAATWADDVKNTEKTAVWHYVDIPRLVKPTASLDAWCPPIGPSVDGKNRPGCITTAIAYELGILRDKGRLAPERAAALRYIVHFVGDIHQPLHDEDNNDQGGNCTAIRFFSEQQPSNLHAIWDYKLIERRMENDKLTQEQYAANLDTRFSNKPEHIFASNSADPVSWAWETHAIGDSITYGKLEPAIPVETPDPQSVCATERDKVRALQIGIGDTYFDEAIAVIDERLATAGFRLAALLNDLFR